MKLRLLILTLLLAATVFSQEIVIVTDSDECHRAAQDCETQRVGWIAGCWATGRADAFCQMEAQKLHLACLRATGCY